MDESWPSPGARCGAYVLVRELGRGGMAVVFEAEHARLQKRVAIKILLPRSADSEVLRARFEREGRAGARVRHPHVVDVVDIGHEGDRPYIVMELIEGPTLAAVLEREAPMSVANALELILPVVSAVARAHAAGVVHRDLKPGNILVASDMRGQRAPKVVDFGISKLLGADEPAITRDHALIGSLPYMAPEQLHSAATAAAAADQWALGVVLYECLTGTLPFRGETSVEVMSAVLAAKTDKPSVRRPELPMEIDAVLMRALEREPSARYPDLRAFGAALLRFANASTFTAWARELQAAKTEVLTEDDSAQDSSSAARPATVTSEQPPPKRRPLLMWLVVAVMGSALLLATQWRRWTSQPAAAPTASPSPSPIPSPGPSATSSVLVEVAKPAPAPEVSSAPSSAPTLRHALPPKSPSISVAPSPAPSPAPSSAPPPAPSPAPIASAPPPPSASQPSKGMFGSPILE